MQGGEDAPMFYAPVDALRWSGLRESTEPRLLALKHGVESWRVSKCIEDEWLMDEALDSLRLAVIRPQDKVRWAPPKTPLFAPRLEIGRLKNSFWLPNAAIPHVVRRRNGTTELQVGKDDVEFFYGSWQEFRKLVHAEVEQKLRAYRKQQERSLGANRPQLAKHAEWTARVFGGESRSSIADAEPSLTGSEDAVGTVKRTVHQFANSIGLTLPKKKTLGESLGSPEEKAGKTRQKSATKKFA